MKETDLGSSTRQLFDGQRLVAVNRWGEYTLDDLRLDWVELGADYVVGVCFRHGGATQESAAQVIDDLCRADTGDLTADGSG